MVIKRARSKKVASLAATLLLTTFAIGVAGPVAFAPAAAAATGTLSGTVFNDYDNNGVKDSGEPGVQGAVVYAYDVDGHQFGPATTDASGVYTLNLTGLTAGAMRVELQSMPAGFEPSAVGSNNATTIRFVNVSAGSTVNNLHFAIQKPLEYCQNNPDIATTAFCVGSGNGANDLATVFHATYDSQTRTNAGTQSQTGAVEGVAWDPITKRVFVSAYVKRHAGLNDTYGADAIYVMNPATNATTHWVDLGSVGIDAGQSTIPLNAARNIVSGSLLSQDPIFGEVGKTGIGDIETNGVDTLYLTNLYQRTVHSVPIAANGAAPTTSTNLGLPGSAVTCTNGTARPFALTYQDGYLYSGIVCDAATGTTADLAAYVVRKAATDTTTGGWAQFGPKVDLNYNKGPVYNAVDSSNSSALNKWHVWDDTMDATWDAGANSSSTGRADFIIRPTPMLSDIEFDDDGSMVLAFRDRTADMVGADNNPPDAADRGTPTWTGDSSGNLVFAMSGGDVLRVCLASGSYVIDGATSACPNHDESGAAANTGQGPNNGEFYPGDGNNAHQEVSDGHVAIAPRSGQLLLSSMNAKDNTYNSAGIRGLSNTTGARIDAISANYYTSERPATGQARFGKANGMGDIEVLCDAAPLEIGNRIWADTNGNGIQDPGEAGIDGVTVRLYAATDTTFTTPLGTAVTSGGGQYYFRTGYTDSNLTDNVGGGLVYRTGYVIRIGTSANYSSGPLAGLALSPANQSPTYTYAGNQDTIDSDPASGGTKATMGSSWFPTIAIDAATTLPGHNNHTYDAGFVAPRPYDLALRKTVVSMTGKPFSGTVTFQLEVFNQTADAVNGVTITDYIDSASFKPMTVLPAAGTTGGSAALAYAWDNSSTTNPTVTISGVIPGNSSVTLNVTLAIATPVKMSGLVNTAEISKFDNDGNPATGDSTTGVVYDVDSIPDAINNDVVVDDSITLKRWTNTATTQTENTSAADEDDHDIAAVPVYDLALIKTRSAGQAATITSPATTANFDITVKNQGQTPVYNVTVLDSPVSPMTRSASTAASQTVTTTLGATVTVSFNSTTGVFTIPSLAAGDMIKFKVVADLALANTVQVNGAEVTGFDNDADPSNAKPSWAQDVDSTPDTIVGNDTIAPGTDPNGFPQDSLNLIDNAPINGVNLADEDDQDTEAVQLGLLRLGSTVYKDANGNGTGDAGEEVPGVLVQLFKADGTGAFNYAAPIAATVTNAHGDYSFDRLFPGTYQVGIPSDQSTAAQPTSLNEWEPVAGSIANPETSNFDNDGAAHAGFISRTDDVVLTYNGEPTNDTADNAYADALTSPRTYTDANSNLNVDFVFNQATYELGNLVWSDNGAGGHYNNGKADSDESGLNGVTVELYRDNGAGGAVANDGILAASERIATTVTAGGGFYDFKNLPAATDYHVVVVKSSVPIGYAVAGTPVTVAAADGVDNDNNAAVVTATGWSSGKIALGPLSSPEPTGEKDGTTGTTASPAASVADNRADQTVDFGFVPSMRIGNQVWRDESDNNPVTQVSTDNNGVFNPAAGEVGLSGVSVELWRDVSHNGFQAAGDDVKVATTTTDTNGNYWFDGVRPGDTYFVAIKTIAGGPSSLVRPTSSTGQSASVTAADNVDDGAPDAASGYLSVSRAFTPTLGAASTGEADANQSGVGAAEAAANARAGVNQYKDTDSELRVDFGFVNVPVYRVGNLVWKDNGGAPYVAADENNGIANPNEPGIAGVEVQLFAAADTAFTTVVATATTDANGEYAFENLVAGDYVVRIPSTGSNAATLTGLTSTKDGATANADVDNDDNGVASSGGWASSTVTLNSANDYQGGEPTTESRRFGEAGTYDNGLSWTTTTADPATYANNRSNLTVDFGFVAKYRLGNLVWRDLNDDGIAQTGEPGIDGVLVQLLSGSTVVAETVTAGGGKYSFSSLLPGNYSVRIPSSQTPALGPVSGIVAGALDGLASSDVSTGLANNDVDNDNNGASGGPLGWDSGVVYLGGAEPTNEQLRANDSTDDDNDSFADAASNYSVDFGFWAQMRLGNTVWIDQSDNDPATYAATDNNGVLNPGEAVLPNVGVAVWRDGGNGVFDAGTGVGADDALAGAAITDAEGNWLVDGLRPGTYFAAIESLPSGYQTFVSSLGQSAADTSVDNVDDGAAAVDGSGNPYAAVSGPVVLTVGGEPTLETDAVPSTDPNGDANAEAEANRTSGLTVRDSDSNLTADMSFVAPPTYRIGNLVWMDKNRNGVADSGEPGIPGVLVQLENSAGTVINETVTNGSGAYGFTADAAGNPLSAGDYRVVIPSSQVQALSAPVLTITPGALSNLSATAYAGDPDTVVADSDSNGSAVVGGWQSTLVTLGGGTTTFETEPTTETLRAGDATDDDFGWAGGTDGRSEFTVDFGFYPGLRLGDTVWFDDGRTGSGTYAAPQENDGIYQATELPAAGVDVELWVDNGDGAFDPTADTYVGTKTTDAQGEYFFIGLDESSTYFAVIPSGAGKADGANNNGTVLSGWRSSTVATSATTTGNDHDHGDDLSLADAYAATSQLISPVRGGMTYGDAADEANANTKTAVTLIDEDSNLVVDFGFSPAPTYQVGNLVWLDANDNGIVDSGESGIGNVTVQLFRDDSDGIFEPNVADGAPVATTTTGTTGTGLGRYEFPHLAAGTYFVYIPKQSAIDGMDSSQVRQANANNNIDNDNNATPFGTVVTGYASSKVELGDVNGAGENGEPTGEKDANTNASAENGAVFDERSNQTVDFGFARRARIGNQVWRDESDSVASTHVATDNNGVFDPASGEVGIAGVSVQLWRDVAGDGIQFGGDDVNVANTATNAEGNYLLDNLIPGANYYVAIPSVGSPLTTARSSAGISATPTAADNDDDGAPLGGYLSVSQRFTVAASGATLGEKDAVEPGDGSSTTDANAEIEANAAGSTYPDAASELAIDFGFVEVPLYRIGNLVWLDANNDGIAQSTEKPLAGVLVQLLDGTGTVIAETTTDANGEYAFSNLAAGDYSVRIPSTQVQTLGGGLTIAATALQNLASSTTEATDPNASATDNDDNGLDVAPGWQSGTVTLGSTTDASATETEPTTEKDFRTATDDDTGWANGTDARSNFTVDFGFYELLRLGDIVWLDNGGTGGAYNPANEDNGVFDAATETLISGVSVNLYRDNGDGVFNTADDAFVGTTVTTSGTYFFTGLTEGTYFVGIPDTELSAGKALATLHSSTGQASTFGVNDRDQGAPDTGFAAVSKVITLKANAMTNGDTSFEARADTRTSVTVSDASSNLAVDFGFAPQAAYALGNLVWEDKNNDGLVSAGETGIPGISVELYQDNGAGGATAGDGVLAASERVATDVTDANGRYLFENLPAGDYIVRIPTSETALNGWFVGGSQLAGVPVTAAGNKTDNDNNAVADATNGGGYTSGVVALGAGNDHQEPTAEVDANTSNSAEAPVATRDDRSDQTVDFGFWRGLRLGNQVWLDEGAGAHQDNGVYDAGETPITGISVELWADDGNGVFDPTVDTMVDNTTTGAEGRYFFEHVAPGKYFVAISSGPAGALSSTGRVGTGLGDDGRDDGDAAGAYVSVSNVLTLAAGTAPTGELDGPGVPADNAEAFANAATATYPDNDSYLTADFGLIDVPLYRIGNLVWNDGNNDGLASATPSENGIDGVLVQLTDPTGTVLAETVTSGGGKYEFDSLAAGAYRVQIPNAQAPVVNAGLSASIVPTALRGFHPSTVASTTPADHIDNDSNGVPAGAVNRSGLITLGGAEPVTEQLRVDNAADDDLGLATPRIDDDRSDFTVDFGYYSISLGNQVFFDANGNGIYEPADGDTGIDGVTVILRDASGAFVDSTTTATGGMYLFTGLVAGTGYYVEIPSTEFAATRQLNGLFSSPGDAGSTGDSNVDGRDRGVDPASPYAPVRSAGLWVATASAAPSATDGNSPNPDNDAMRPDSAENLVVDLGFYRMELGGTVFLDPTNNGLDGADGDFANVRVLLYNGDGSAYLRADGSQASTVTDSSGNYVFSGLPAGDYLVEIPSSEFDTVLDGFANSDGNDPVPSPNNDVTGEDNGYPVSGDIFSGGAVRSQIVTLNLAGEPQDDQSPTAGYADTMSNLSVDFGFWHAQAGLELGNQVWFDTDRDGFFNHGESAAPAGVVLQLLDANTGAVLDTTTTDTQGQYLFTGLNAGRYVVKLPPVNFILGGPLAGYMATDGAGVSGNPNDGTDSDSNALPLSVLGMTSAEVTLRAAAPILEADQASKGVDDRQSNLTVDFGLFLGTPESLAHTGAELPLRQAGLLFGLGLVLLMASRRRREE